MDLFFLSIFKFVFYFPFQMEDVIARMQDEKNGIPIRTVKSFLSKIPSVFSGKSQSEFHTVLKFYVRDALVENTFK